MKRVIYHAEQPRTFCLNLYIALFLSVLNGSVLASESQDVFSVMTYNVRQYTLMDRDRDGKADDPKPDSECRAVAQVIASQRPDVLVVQEMGNSVMFSEFRKQLLDAGLDYPYAELLEQGRWDINLALLSRFPIVSVQNRTNQWYSIGEAKVPVARGFLDVDIQVNETYRFRLLAAHLKSKVFSPLGQTEMRRNEARLLNKIIREILKEAPDTNLMAVGDFNDDYNSAPLREVSGRRGGPMTDLRPVDSVGDVWTYFWSSTDIFSRFDYIFVSNGMLPEVVREQTRVVRDPLTYQASDHRPVIAVFRAVDQ